MRECIRSRRKRKNTVTRDLHNSYKYMDNYRVVHFDKAVILQYFYYTE